MKLTQEQCDFILNSKFCIIATSGKQNQPRACVVMPEMAFDDKVIIADCQMGKTRENILANPRVFLSFYDNNLEWCMKCEGIAEYVGDVENSAGGASCRLSEPNWNRKVCRLQELSSQLSNQSTSTKNILNAIKTVQQQRGFAVAGLVLCTVSSAQMCK